MSGRHTTIEAIGTSCKCQENRQMSSQVSFWAHSPVEMSRDPKKVKIQKKTKDKSYYRKNFCSTEKSVQGVSGLEGVFRYSYQATQMEKDFTSEGRKEENLGKPICEISKNENFARVLWFVVSSHLADQQCPSFSPLNLHLGC